VKLEMIETFWFVRLQFSSSCYNTIVHVVDMTLGMGWSTLP